MPVRHIPLSLTAKGHPMGGLLLWVIRTRFERVTDCLEGSCSIQLSYRTIIA